MLTTHRTFAAAHCGLVALLAATAGACNAPAAPPTPAAADPPAPARPARATTFERTRARAVAALAAYGNPGSRYEMRAVAFLATPPPAEVTETLYFTYLEQRPDGSSRTGRGVARCRDAGRQLVSFWRREDAPV